MFTSRTKNWFFVFFVIAVAGTMFLVNRADPQQSSAHNIGLIIAQEADGSPSDAVYKIKFPNGTLAISGAVGTYTDGSGAIGGLTNDYVPYISSGAWADSPIQTDGTDTAVGQAPVSGSKWNVPQENDAATPTFSFGDGDSGIYEESDDKIVVGIAGTKRIEFDGWTLTSPNSGSYDLYGQAGSSTTPVYRFRGDANTGFSRADADKPVVIAGGVPSQVWGEVTTLSTAQINALQGTPITLIAAQGANKIIEIESIILTYDYATAAFTVGADEDFVIEYADGTDISASIETTGFIDQADDEIRRYVSNISDAADLEASINQAVQISNTGAGETADGGGELDVRLVYRVYAIGF